MTSFISNCRSGLTILALLGLLLGASGASAETKRALLIGINKYQQLPWLSGSRNDVMVIKDILVRRYGFHPQNIRTLFDEQATRDAILQALENLVAAAGPDDTVFVHYSGHGSQVKDLNNDESDNLDETICPTDARTANVPDITDDELGRILGRLKVASAVVILDSCHSGTALRSVPSDIRLRAVPPDTRVELYDDDHIVTRGVVPAPGTEPYVLFSAAAAHQQELDGPFGPDGQPLGLLTAALSRAFEAHAGKVTPRELLKSVERNVEKIKPMFAGHAVPEAQLEGQLRLIDAPLFSPTADSPHQQLLTTSALKKPQAGKKKIFANKEKRRLLRRAIPDDSDEFEWTDDIEEADAVIDCADDTACDVYGPSGVVRIASVPAVSSRLATMVAQADSVAELLSFDELSGAINLHLGAAGRTGTSSAPQGSRGIKLTASVANHHIRYYVPGDERTEQNSLQLTVTTDTACYLTLVTVDSAGTVLQLLPNPIQEQRNFLPDGYLQPGQTHRIPDSFADSNAAGFHFDYGPPAGTDTVRAFCTTDPGLAKALQADIAQIANGVPGVSVGNTLISARGLTGLRPNQEQAASPGGSSGAWGSATMTIDISQQ